MRVFIDSVSPTLTHRHGSDGALGEEPLVLLELPVPLVAPGAAAAVALALVGAVLVGGEVPVPTTDYVAVEVSVLEITALEGVDLKGGREFWIFVNMYSAINRFCHLATLSDRTHMRRYCHACQEPRSHFID